MPAVTPNGILKEPTEINGQVMPASPALAALLNFDTVLVPRRADPGVAVG